ncbi:MAG: cobalt-precorrin-5B (C(1))-methyltransferase CbiD [Armatimonadota bacterium]
MSSLRTGFTTGACAAAAAKAATMLLTGQAVSGEVEIGLPDGSRVGLPLAFTRETANGAEAGVKKDAGDDPDITHGVTVIASVTWTDRETVELAAGDGVGTVTKPGLQIRQGEPAINPVPRRMICEAVREVTNRGVRIVISVPGGRKLAEKTFNPRLGVVGGISILGTTGIVRPFSNAALRDALKCSLDVAAASGVTTPVLVPGHIGERAANRHFSLSTEQVVEVSNEWGFMLDCAAGYRFTRLLILGHPGKLAKLCEGQWDTHSSKSESAVPIVARLCEETLGVAPPESATVEGLFAALSPEDRKMLGDTLAARLRGAIYKRFESQIEVSTVLVNMQGEILGSDGDLSEWQ